MLDEADFLDYLLRDEGTDAVTMYLEGFKRGRAFFDLALKAEKPIIIQKSNRFPASAQIAQSHTTALSSSDDVVEGAFRQAAVIRVEDEQEFVNAVKIVRLPAMKGRRVAVLSRSGGHAVLSADACAKHHFDMVPFPPSYIDKLKTIYHTRGGCASESPGPGRNIRLHHFYKYFGGNPEIGRDRRRAFQPSLSVPLRGRHVPDVSVRCAATRRKISEACVHSHGLQPGRSDGHPEKRSLSRFCRGPSKR